MKVIFLDIDGVLNSNRTIYENVSLEDDLILNLKEIVDRTEAKIILSSSWRLIPEALSKVMDKLFRYDLSLSGVTDDGISVEFINKFEFKYTNRYLDEVPGLEADKRIKITHDRGAEIFKWLCDHDDCSYIIIDDDIFDIEPYFKKEVILKTSFKTGLTKEDVKKAIKILGEKND